MGDLSKDKRFSHVTSDPRFRNIPKNERKIKIDKRFQSVFTDKRFQLKYAVDIRGRPVRETQADNYKKYYDISSSDSDSDDDASEEEKDSVEDKVEESNELSQDSSLTNDNDLENDEKSIVSQTDSDLKLKSSKALNKKLSKAIDEEHKTKISDAVHGRLQDMTVDYARGIGTIISDSSSDESSSDESDSIFVEHPWGELDKDADTTDEATRRLAICYLDWDRIYAKDIMVLLHSFLPADGIIESVTVYPSEFGLERMKEEEREGPKELVEVTEAEGFEEDDGDNEEGKAYHREKLREYQLNRLKYYYAVVVCNSVDTANKLYIECNGMEYESCAAKLDMRFIPDDMTFEQEPREVCKSLPDVSKYKPRLFENSALRMGKVSLTWDETDPRRIEFTKRIVSGDVNDDDLNNYIASSSEGSEAEVADSAINNIEESSSDEPENDEPKDKLSKYRSIIASLKSEEEKKKSKDVEMEISWGLGDVKGDKDESNDNKRGSSTKTKASSFKGKSAELSNSSEDESADQSSSDEENVNLSGKKKKLRKGNKMKNVVVTPDEERKNAELELLLADDNLEESKKTHFSLKNIQKQEKEGKAKKKKWRKELKKKINASKEEDNFKVDVTDNRFSALYTSHLFNIDPAHPQFKKTKAMEEFIHEKQKRRKLQEKEQEISTTANSEKRQLNPELSSLVSSIKGKTNKRKINL